MLDTHKGADSCMSPCLYKNALCRIYKDNGKFRKGCSYCHVSCIFFMTWGICNDKRTVLCCKIAVSDVNCDSLLSLSHQAVKKERIVNCPTTRTNLTVKL